MFVSSPMKNVESYNRKTYLQQKKLDNFPTSFIDIRFIIYNNLRIPVRRRDRKLHTLLLAECTDTKIKIHCQLSSLKSLKQKSLPLPSRT